MSPPFQLTDKGDFDFRITSTFSLFRRNTFPFSNIKYNTNAYYINISFSITIAIPACWRSISKYWIFQWAKIFKCKPLKQGNISIRFSICPPIEYQKHTLVRRSHANLHAEHKTKKKYCPIYWNRTSDIFLHLQITKGHCQRPNPLSTTVRPGEGE